MTTEQLDPIWVRISHSRETLYRQCHCYSLRYVSDGYYNDRGEATLYAVENRRRLVPIAVILDVTSVEVVNAADASRLDLKQ